MLSAGSEPAFLAGGGEMGALMRAHDWSASPLGPPERWPQSLRSVVGLMLNSGFPMFAAWGPELGFLYNDAYVPILGAKHPAALGARFEDAWSDIWADLQPLVDASLAGQASYFEDLPLTMHRNGFGEDTWFTFSYSPVYDEHGRIGGMFCACTETTGAVLARRALIERTEMLGESAAELQAVLDAVPAAIWIARDPAAARIDGNELARTVLRAGLDANLSVTPADPAEAPIGFRILDRDGEVIAPVDLPVQRAARGETVRDFEEDIVFDDGQVVTLVGNARPLLDADGRPRGSVASFVNISARKRVEAALRESEARHRFRAELGDALRGLSAPADIMVVVAERLGSHLRVDQANYYRIDGPEHFVVSEEWRTEASCGMIGRHALAGFGAAIPARMEAGEVLRLDDTRDAEGAEGFAAAGMAAVLSAPLHSGGRWAGGFHVHSTVPRVWTDAEAALVQETAERAWAAVEQARAEAELRRSEEFNRRILASSADCIKVLDLDGRLEFMSEGGMGVMEVDDFGAIKGAWWPSFWTGDDHARALAAIDEAKSGGTGRFQGFATTMKGTPRWWDVVVTPVGGADGGVQRLLSVSRDITAGKEAEARLHALNADLERQVIERTQERGRTWAITSDMLSVIDLNTGAFDRVNPAWTATLGWSADELEGAVFADFVHPDDIARSFEGLEVLKRGDPLLQFENRYRTKAGDYRWVRWMAVPEGGKLYSTTRDVTDEKAQAAELAARTAERDQMWETSPDLMLVIDFEGVFRRVNPAWTTLLGYEPEELIDRHVNMFVVPDDHGETIDAYELAAAGGRPRLVNRYRHKDGSIRWISWVAAPTLGMTYATGRDVTREKEREVELVQAQEALRQSQKMDAMGQLTGGVAHDFNNLLTPIIGSLDMLVRKGVGSERERRLIDGALQSAERAKTLVQRLLAFARRQPLQPVAVEVARLVDGMAALIGSTLGPTIDVRVELAPDLPAAKADPNQLEMALLNLAVNARDAMPDGGELTLEARRESVRDFRVAGVRPGHYVRLSVTDSGVGMDQATLARAVEPFFSTKGIGKGTGLGLSMVHGLTAQLGGGLTIESAPGRGTSIALWLPISAAAADAEESAAPAAAAQAGRGMALLVDDEELVRMSTADMLIDLGFEVVEAGSAEEALQLMEGGAAPDLLVTDHLMPGMNGADLARAARALKPALPVLVVSGYAEVEGVELEWPRLTKPFRNAELAASVSTLVP